MIKKIAYCLVALILISCSSVDSLTSKEHKYEVNPIIKVKVKKDSSSYRGIVYKKGDNNINEIRLEEYLYSVVGSEMPKSFETEALKAQAIAARTYAILHNGKLYDDVRSQAYNGKKSESEKVKNAVDETRGLILTYNDRPIDALYSSSCGTRTLAAYEYFENDIPYLQSVEDYTGEKTWEIYYTLDEFNSKLKLNTSNILQVDAFIYLDEKVYTTRQIKEKLKLKSSKFKIQLIDNMVYIKGEGFGHCVGMSQFGANNLAKRGYNYNQILNHYYTGVKIKRIY